MCPTYNQIRFCKLLIRPSFHGPTIKHGHAGNQSDFMKHFKGHVGHQFNFTKIIKKHLKKFTVTT